MPSAFAAFPRRYRRGLIEAPCLDIPLAKSARFPRRYRRGLIEAVALTVTDGPIWADFRDDIVAASLKLYLVMRHTLTGFDFRDDIVAASLKQRR